MTKRMLDVIVATALVVVAAPLIVAVAVAVWVTMGSPVLFRQTRPGLHARPFVLWKFRTMRLAPPGSELDGDEERLTRLGAFLRRSSLDELPELVNVLKGDMSLVGPRPLLMEYVALYDAEQARRHDVRPGVTGLAQISGRNRLDWAQRFALDVWYVDHRSLALDIWILLRTVPSAVLGIDTSAAGHLSAPRFRPCPASANAAVEHQRVALHTSSYDGR